MPPEPVDTASSVAELLEENDELATELAEERILVERLKRHITMARHRLYGIPLSSSVTAQNRYRKQAIAELDAALHPEPTEESE